MKKYFALKFGILTAILFEVIAWSFVLGTCLRSPDDCHEYGFLFYFFERPALFLVDGFFYYITIPFSPLSQSASNVIGVLAFVIAGFIQYFLIGYAIGWGILLFRKLRHTYQQAGRKTAS